MPIIQFPRSTHPSIHTFVTRDLPALPYAKPGVFQAVLDTTLHWKRSPYPPQYRDRRKFQPSYQRALITRAFLGSGPPLKIYSLAAIQSHVRYAHTDPMGTITLDKKYADQTEAALARESPPTRGTSKDPGAPVAMRLRLLLEATIVHEMVHWIWDQVLKQREPVFAGHNDIGWEFNRRAYGRDMTAPTLGLYPTPLNLR